MSTRSRGQGLDPRLRLVVAIVALLVGLTVATTFVDRATRGRAVSTGETRGSARSTATDGVRAYRELLGRYGVETRSLAGSLRRAPSSDDTTLMVLDGGYPSDTAARTVRDFVAAGGRAVVAGPEAPTWIGDTTPVARRRGAATTTVEVDGDRYRVHATRSPRWDVPAGSALLVTRRIGRGEALLLSSSSPLQNAMLADADNAAFGIALVGGRPRVAFAEGPHGLGTATGLDAVPVGWRVALFGTPLALLLAAVAAGRRIGGAEPRGRELAPARREAVDALAAALARSRRPEGALVGAQRQARRAFCRAADLPPDAPDDDVRAAARRAGWSDRSTSALLRPPGDRATTLELGRALARTRRGTP